MLKVPEQKVQELFLFLKYFLYICKMERTNIKPFGYWNKKENCFEEAKKYENKYELEKKCSGCYQGAVRNGWLDEIAELYDGSIHYMGYNEPINCVYIYEYKDLNSFYVGRTNNIKRRHRQHCNGYGHRDGTRTYDVVYTFAKENGIEIPKPVILEEKLTAEQSQEREDPRSPEAFRLRWRPK